MKKTLLKLLTCGVFSAITNYSLISCSGEQCSPLSDTIPYNYINSIPQNAEVYYNDSLIGFTPLRFFPPFPLGRTGGTIILKLNGFKDYIYNLQPSDTLLNKTFYLTPSISKPQNKGELLVTENKKFFFKKPRKIIPITVLGTLSIGSAVSAYYFKNLANDKYDEYLKNGERNLLDKTKKYDLISGISLAVFQLGLLGVLYFLFVE